MGGTERLVAVTGRLQSGLLRIVDVDIQGNPIGNATYLPGNAEITVMEKSISGFLEEPNEEEDAEAIDWEAHESSTGRISEDEVESESEFEAKIDSAAPRNPALAAFPELQEE